MITYSKIVLFLKLAFFITALAILGVLFMISPPDRFGEPVKVSTLGLDKNIAYQVLGAKLRGALETGHRFDFKVDSIDPDEKNPDDFSLTNLTGTLSIFEKDIYNISAKKAQISSEEDYIDLTGNLKIRTKSGISGTSQSIRIRFNSVDLIVSNGVELNTPLGIIFGGTMKISNASLSHASKPIIQLEKGVKLLINSDQSPKATQ